MEIKLLLVLCYFNPRTPRGVRLAADAPTPPHPCISIHAPREGCDTAIAASYTPLDLFQSTHPARGATCAEHCDRHPCGISIHAPREGCDPMLPNNTVGNEVISIHAPREGCDYQSASYGLSDSISIHAPREGCDLGRANLATAIRSNFNPRTPRGVRRNSGTATTSDRKFQSTHPARGATANFTKEQRVCLAQFAYLHKGKKAEHTKTNAPMLH